MKQLFQARLAQKERDRKMELHAWRASRTTTKTLPSGLEVTLKRVSLLDLAMNGNIPNALAGMVDDVIDAEKIKKVQAADFAQFGQVIDLVVKACVISPMIADVADEEHLAVSELPMEDRLEVFSWANEGVEQIAPFRPQTG